ncbi:MAG: hypothetical protein PHQ18_03225, partial [Patescibacteria group bacterium]|nr:hypothetical protein [Patescibacteria group bacterium]
MLFPKSSFAILYAPGQTLDPACLPTDLNCGVYPSVSLTTSTYAVGDILFASTTDSFALLNLGTPGQFLKATASGIVWDSIPGGGDLLSTNNLSELTNTTDARSNLGLVIGTNVQAFDAGLLDIAGLSFADGNFLVGNGTNWVAESGATARTSLGLGSVENTALSTWTGNTSISSIGTITTGTWQGSVIASTYLASNVMLSGENISSLTNDANYVTTTQATSLAKAAISTSGLALNYANGVISVASGYNIPLTASTTNWNNAYNIVNASSTNWNNFYNTPSDRISLGTGLVWSGNTIQANTGYNIPLTASTTNWQTAFSWGNHAGAGYLTSYTEADPIWTAASSTYLTTTTANSTYLTQANAISTYLSLVDWNATTTDALTEGIINKYYSDTLARNSLSSTALGLTYNNTNGQFSLTSGYNIPLTASTTNWQTAFSWGNHAGAGYLTSYTETDPIWNSVSSTYLATTTASNTYLAIANNLSDLNSSSTARTNLGLVIGNNVQAYNSNLATLAGLSTSPDYNFIISKSGSWGSFGATTAKTYMG